MKYWRRHKHELHHTEDDEPLPSRPEKKMRYSREDDILLAKYFFNKPEGTSDKIFQAFGRIVRLLLTSAFSASLMLRSILIIRGKDGKNITGSTKPRLITMCSNSQMAKILILLREPRSRPDVVTS
jgi:hypothetical protein